jgi:hypothetical protein
MSKVVPASEYNINVFVNCPFDREYRGILHAIVFAVIDCGYTVRCALEAEDFCSTRIEKIYALIDQSRFGVHDISRIQQDLDSGLPRFNMPFELGVFLGARRYGSASQQRKSCLVLEAKQYEYQQFLSDIAGQDIRQHGNSPRKAVGAVRDWLAASRPRGKPTLPGSAAILTHYSEFQRALPEMLAAANPRPSELGFFDRTKFVGVFVKRRVVQSS